MTVEHHIRPGDIMLRWASEQETGTWTQFRQAAATCLAASTDIDKASTLALRMSDLGHLDIDWSAGLWSVAPPVLAVARGMGMCAYLAGWRTNWLELRYEQATDELDVFPLEHRQRGAPAVKYAKCGSVAAIEELADALHVRVVWDPSGQLADLVFLPATADLPLGATPPIEDGLEMFDPFTGEFRKVATTVAEGLYRYELHGRPAHRLHVDGDWRIVDRATGMLHMVRGQPLMRWHRHSVDLTIARALTVPSWLTLPAIAERSLVAATGLLPVHQCGRRIYRNVTRDVAQRIADALGIALQIDQRPLPVTPRGAT